MPEEASPNMDWLTNPEIWIALVTLPTLEVVLELAKWMERRGWFGRLTS